MLRIFQLDVSRHIDDLLTEMYTDSVTLQAILQTLSSNARRWPKQLKKSLRIPIAECRIVAGKAYYRDRMIINPEDTNIHL